MERNRETAEAHRAELRRQEEEANRRLLSVEWAVGALGVGGFFMGLLAGSLEAMDMPWRAAFIVGGAAMLFVGTYYALKIEQSAGYYECPMCGERYVPTMKAVFFAPHIGRTRWMKCPGCGRRAFQKKALTR